MPGLDWDLNLAPDLQAMSRRLSFSDSPSASASPPGRGRTSGRGENRTNRYEHAPTREPRLPRIEEDCEEAAAAAETPVQFPQCTAAPSSLGTSSGALYPAPGETPHLATSAPVATSLALAPPAPSQCEAVAAARMLEGRRQGLLGEYQRLRQAALAAEAALQLQLQQAWAAAWSESQQLSLYTVNGGPAGYETRWEELHPVSREMLLQIEDTIRQYRDESGRLDQCSCLDDRSLHNKSFGLDSSQISQEAGSISTVMDREKVSIESLTAVVKEIMRNTEFAIRSYVKLRPRFVHRSAGSANLSGSSGVHFTQLLTWSPTFRCYSGAPRRPSPFVQYTVARFKDHLGECCKWVLELEQLVQIKNDKTFAEFLESLSKVMSNVHDYLIHVAAKVEDIHQYVQTMKTQYLSDRWHRGANDPFLEADRREAAKQEATARIVHPVLHLSSPG